MDTGLTLKESLLQEGPAVSFPLHNFWAVKSIGIVRFEVLLFRGL